MKNYPRLARLIRLINERIVCTGGVVFIGGGNTGKTHTALSLTGYRGLTFTKPETGSLKRSVNLEFNYFVFQSNIEEYQLTISSQIFVMPGQKGRAKRGEGLAFEDAADFFFDAASINEVLVLVLTYNLTEIQTFQELEYWLRRAIERDIIQDYTSVIILGTHLDFKDKIMINDENLEEAKNFVSSYILRKKGIDINSNIYSIKVSNVTEEGLEDLRQAIYQSFLSAFSFRSYYEDS